jgi:ABC-2 type transport system ATP-binding protein
MRAEYRQLKPPRQSCSGTLRSSFGRYDGFSYTAPMTCVLRVEGARKRFGSSEALGGVNLHLRAGEWIALLGPNGAGKTTLIRSIAGRVRLDEGRIALFDRELKPGDREGRRDLGIVPQEIALYPLLTARENLEVFGSLAGLNASTVKERVEWALDFTRLADRAREPIQRFSGGMKRRLNIAASVLHKPRVVLLDEPTVGVDPQSREHIWEMLSELRQGGASLLLTTHQLDEAQQVCDRVVIIDHGKVIADGTLDHLIATTVGRHRHVVLRLDRPAPSTFTGGSESNGNQLRCKVYNVAAELPALLTQVRDAGCTIEDVQVDGPSLHTVFLHLTGRELRE